MNQLIDPEPSEPAPKMAHWILGSMSCFFFVLGYGVLILSNSEPSRGPSEAALGGCFVNLSALCMAPLGFLLGCLGVAKNKRSTLSWVGILLSVILACRVWTGMQ